MPSLQFKGKALVQNHHLAVPFCELEPVRSKGLNQNPSLHDNLILEGDNLRALKALLPTYHGKVRCNYIDPPYNTGNEGWVYNDKVNSPMVRDWLGKTVDRDDLTRHDKWCCMMLPRLRLLRELLSDDGAIFASIDDNEVHHLRAPRRYAVKRLARLRARGYFINSGNNGEKDTNHLCMLDSKALNC